MATDRKRRFSVRLVACGIIGTGLAAAFVVPASASSTSANSCVALLNVEHSKSTTRVDVQNFCNSKQCYKIDVKGYVDPTFSVAAHAEEHDAVGGPNLTIRKIYGGGPC